MGKIVTEKTVESSDAKIVEVKHTRTMLDATGNEVVVVDYIEQKTIEDAIAQCEAHKVSLESQLTECEAELADYIVIRDAE